MSETYFIRIYKGVLTVRNRGNKNFLPTGKDIVTLSLCRSEVKERGKNEEKKLICVKVPSMHRCLKGQ